MRYHAYYTRVDLRALGEYLDGRRKDQKVLYLTARNPSKTYTPNGRRECARRERQRLARTA